jgi:hypothetical protein
MQIAPKALRASIQLLFIAVVSCLFLIGPAAALLMMPGMSTLRVATVLTKTKASNIRATRSPVADSGFTNNRDILISRAAKLRQTIVKQQVELIALERKIECCRGNQEIDESELSSAPNIRIGKIANAALVTFISSTNVLFRKLGRVKDKVGPNNKQWNSVSDYIVHEMEAGIRIVTSIVQRPDQIQQLIDPRTPTLVPHVPAILARLDKLEIYVSPILERVLNNRQHLASIEPYLAEILERFDDIEPHLQWILDNIDALAPYTGLLLKHIDALLLFAESEADDDDFSEFGDDAQGGTVGVSKDYSLANQLLPYLEYYVSKLDVVGPHLVLLRPHVPLLLKHNRIGRVSPHIDKLFARGYGTKLAASANMDILLFWFGWTLRIPFVPALFFALPFSPRLVSFLANRLPKKFARRGKSYCRNMMCTIDDDYGGSWNKLESKSA